MRMQIAVGLPLLKADAEELRLRQTRVVILVVTRVAYCLRCDIGRVSCRRILLVVVRGLDDLALEVWIAIDVVLGAERL